MAAAIPLRALASRFTVVISSQAWFHIVLLLRIAHIQHPAATLCAELGAWRIPLSGLGFWTVPHLGVARSNFVAAMKLNRLITIAIKRLRVRLSQAVAALRDSRIFKRANSGMGSLASHRKTGGQRIQ